MTINYQILVSIDLGDAIDEVGALMEEINSHLTKWGYDEKLGVSSEVLTGTLTCDRTLTSVEEKEICRLMQTQIEKSMPSYKFSVQCKRSQSRKSCRNSA